MKYGMEQDRTANRRRRARRQAWIAGLVVALAAGCQGPPECDVHHAVETAPMVPIVDSLRPLAEAFDSRAEVPRIVALLPDRCDGCGAGLDSIRSGVLESFPGRDLHVFVIFPGHLVCDGCGSKVDSILDTRVTLFRDPEGRAARAFARGLLPVAEARQLFLFYPAGARWCDAPDPAAEPSRLAPATRDWWHGLGRIAPDRYCTHYELDSTLRSTMVSLLGEER